MREQAVIVAAPLFHMNALTFCHMLLYHRGTIILMEKFDAARYIAAVDAYNVAVVSGVPTMIAMIARENHLLKEYDLSGVRQVSLGSAPITPALMETIATVFPNAIVTNSYGTTEIGPAVFGPHPDGLPRPALSLGYPDARHDLRLVGGDENQGILEVKGPSLMQEYVGQPELTRQRLGSGYYNTGDIMRRDEQGFFYFVGRADDMFVCSGENIYPREVESLLEKHPAVEEAAVVPLPDPVRGQMPIAFVVRRPGSEVTEEEIKAFALREGPPHLHPRRTFFIDTMPLSGTNKIDKNALAKLASDTAQPTRNN
jgi:long-chain acyl-CoA synthetase